MKDYKFQKAVRKRRRSLGVVVLTTKPRNPRVGLKGEGKAPPVGGLLGGTRVTIGYDGVEKAGSAE